MTENTLQTAKQGAFRKVMDDISALAGDVNDARGRLGEDADADSPAFRQYQDALGHLYGFLARVHTGSDDVSVAGLAVSLDFDGDFIRGLRVRGFVGGGELGMQASSSSMRDDGSSSSSAKY